MRLSCHTAATLACSSSTIDGTERSRSTSSAPARLHDLVLVCLEAQQPLAHHVLQRGEVGLLDAAHGVPERGGVGPEPPIGSDLRCATDGVEASQPASDRRRPIGRSAGADGVEARGSSFDGHRGAAEAGGEAPQLDELLAERAVEVLHDEAVVRVGQQHQLLGGELVRFATGEGERPVHPVVAQRVLHLDDQVRVPHPGAVEVGHRHVGEAGGGRGDAPHRAEAQASQEADLVHRQHGADFAVEVVQHGFVLGGGVGAGRLVHDLHAARMEAAELRDVVDGAVDRQPVAGAVVVAGDQLRSGNRAGAERAGARSGVVSVNTSRRSRCSPTSRRT